MYVEGIKSFSNEKSQGSLKGMTQAQQGFYCIHNVTRISGKLTLWEVSSEEDCYEY
jgi:hypothetical protein